MPIDFRQLSRTVSHALRHEPWLYELELDDEGWTSVTSVMEALRHRRGMWAALTESDIRLMVEKSAKRRYELRDDRIRALYGHSIAGKLSKELAVPPDILFHGTAPDVIPQIKSSGLRPMRRQFVHLSTDTDTAQEVGRRKSKEPKILSVRAMDAHSHGVSFYEGNEMVWLADQIPPEFIDFS